MIPLLLVNVPHGLNYFNLQRGKRCCCHLQYSSSVLEPHELNQAQASEIKIPRHCLAANQDRMVRRKKNKVLLFIVKASNFIIIFPDFGKN